MTSIFPVHTIVRQVTNWGFAVAIRLDTGTEKCWSVVDAYGEMSDWGDEFRTDAQFQRWTTIYDPTAKQDLLDKTSAASMRSGSIKRLDSEHHAIKLDQPEGSPCWLVFDRHRSVDLLDDEQVGNWATVHVAVDSDTWAEEHGLNPHPNPDTINTSESEIVVWS